MEICIVKFLILVHLIDLLPTLYVNATHASQLVNITKATSSVSATTTLSGKVTSTKTRTTIKMTTTTEEKTNSETTTRASTVNSEATTISTTDHERSKNDTAQNAFTHDKNKHQLMFYISLAVGSVFATFFFLLVLILVTRSMRQKKAKKKSAVYWAKINRARQSQFLSNEGVSSNNPMYDGSRSRATRNVLYGVPENEDTEPKSCCTNENVLTVSTHQSPEFVIGNASCEHYQNADDLYDELGKFSENGTYECIRSLFLYENSDVKTSTEESNTEPSVLFEITFITENSGYVSAEPRTN